MCDLARANGILFIADEVVTAFGRVGHWFASSGEFGIEPDIINCAKGLTSGCCASPRRSVGRRVHEVINTPDPDAWFAHGFTYSGHPVCCAVAQRNIEIIKREGILEHARRVGDYFEGRLEARSFAARR